MNFTLSEREKLIQAITDIKTQARKKVTQMEISYKFNLET